MSPPGQKQRGSPILAEEKESEAAVIAANGFLLRHYSTSLMGGSPRRQTEGHLWLVPIVLTSPGYGAVGEVGSVTVDAKTGRIEGGTPKDEVTAAMGRLMKEKQGALEAAFHRSRTP